MTSAATTRLLACIECDALLRIKAGGAASFRCPRCGALLHRAVPGGLDSALAFYLAAAVLFVIANCFPIVSIEAAGTERAVTLPGAALALRAQGMNLVALVVITTTVVIPAVEVLVNMALLLLARQHRASRMLPALFRLREGLRPWSMVEIFVLGAFVAIVKLGNLASVVLGIGIWSLFVFMVTTAAAAHHFDSQYLWDGGDPS